jgi:cytochrome d ubiquinol oxidase subunit II
VYLIVSIINNFETSPFLLSIWLFFLNYLGLAISLWPWVIPYQVTIWEAAATSESLSLLLVGTIIALPLVLGYTAYNYYVFRGKTTHEVLY